MLRLIPFVIVICSAFGVALISRKREGHRKDSNLPRKGSMYQVFSSQARLAQRVNSPMSALPYNTFKENGLRGLANDKYIVRE